MNQPTPILDALNARRRRAVELRLDGRSLAQVRHATGLSVPTIIRAYDAFRAGGWAAIDVAPRGRPVGAGRQLGAAQEAALRRLVLSSPAPAGMWNRTALQRQAAERAGVTLDTRAATRLLERWGLALVPLRQRAAATADGAQWLRSTWEPALASATNHHRPLLWWVGALPHPDCPAPGGLWVAASPRGAVSWLACTPMAHESSVLALLDGLLASSGERAAQVYLHGPDLSRAPRVSTWLTMNPRLRLATCPVAPRPRRAAAPWPDASESLTPVPCAKAHAHPAPVAP